MKKVKLKNKNTMRYFYDTEFTEGPQKICYFGLHKDSFNKLSAIALFLLAIIFSLTSSYVLGIIFLLPAIVVLAFSFPTVHETIDLISIGIVDERGRELYLINKEFNVTEAWGRYQREQLSGDSRNIYPGGIKVYWIRENVLRPIFNQMVLQDRKSYNDITKGWDISEDNFTKKNFKKLLAMYGTTRLSIKNQILSFTEYDPTTRLVAKEGDIIEDVFVYLHESKAATDWKKEHPGYTEQKATPMELWADYCAYDHVVLCWIFGLMIELPNYFPMYTNDIQQLSTTVYAKMKARHEQLKLQGASLGPFIKNLKEHPKYPKNTAEHNALSDAKYTKDVYLFLKDVTY